MGLGLSWAEGCGGSGDTDRWEGQRPVVAGAIQEGPRCLMWESLGQAREESHRSGSECLVAEMKEERGMADTVISVDGLFLSRIFICRGVQ